MFPSFDGYTESSLITFNSTKLPLFLSLFHLSLSFQPRFCHFIPTYFAFLSLIQCDQIWQNLATMTKFYKSLATFWLFISYLAKQCYIIGLIFIVASGQILKHNLTIWSHCTHFIHVLKTSKIAYVTIGSNCHKNRIFKHKKLTCPKIKELNKFFFIIVSKSF